MPSAPSSPRTRRELGRRASFWVAAAVVVHTLWTSAAPAMSYPLYAALWHLTPTVTTGMFAVYPVTVVTTLLLFGNLSDTLGRRALILAGITASLIGVGLFAAASSVAWVYVGRMLMGMGVGLSASPATAALVEFSAPGQQARANMIATAATALGVGVALLLGGGLIQYAPRPLRLNFDVLFVVLALLLACAWFLPRPTAAERAEAPRWSPGSVIIPRGILRTFITAATGVVASYTQGAIMLSLGAQVARDLIGSSNALVNGASLSVFAIATAVTAVVAKRLGGMAALACGGLSTALSMFLLMLAAVEHSLPIFLLSIALSGAGNSLLLMGGLTVINACAPAHHRAGTLSAIYLVGYLLMGALALAMGVVATHHGLQTAIDIGAPIIAVMSLAGTLLTVLEARRPAPSRAGDASRATA